MKTMRGMIEALVVTVVCLWLGLTGAGDVMAFQSWDKKLDGAAQRFKVLPQFNDEVVLDKETGLVWQRSPLGKSCHMGTSGNPLLQPDAGRAYGLAAPHGGGVTHTG